MPFTNGTNQSSNITQRIIAQNERAVSKSLERIASGLKINGPSDSPASFVVSEKIRSQVKGIEQAIENTEVGIGLLQLADTALSQIEDHLRTINQIAIRAANSGALSTTDPTLDQFDLEEAIQSIDHIVSTTKFGDKNIIDGTSSYSAHAQGSGLEVISLNENTQANKGRGYDVHISKIPRKAKLVGEKELDTKLIEKGVPELFRFEKDDFILDYHVEYGKPLKTIVDELNTEFQNQQVDLKISLEKETNYFIVESTKYGSDQNFRVSSTIDDIFGNSSDSFKRSKSGKDVSGTINGEKAFGKGDTLTASENNPLTSGLKIRYHYIPKFPLNNNGRPILSSPPLEREPYAGKIFVKQNALRFQIGENANETVAVNLKDVRTEHLGNKIDNESEFKSLRDVNVTTFNQATDTIKIVDKSLEEIIALRAEIGALQKFSLESNLRSASIARENLIAANSSILDANLAEEVSNLTQNKVKLNTSVAVLAQANQLQNNILKLLGEDKP